MMRYPLLGLAWRRGLRDIRRLKEAEAFDDYRHDVKCRHGLHARQVFVDEEHGERDVACQSGVCCHMRGAPGDDEQFVDEEHES